MLKLFSGLKHQDNLSKTKVMECQEKVIENQQKILNVAKNPFKNQAKRKV